MELKEFIAVIAEQYEDTDTSSFSESTEFKNFEEWSSLMALTFIAIIDENYDLAIKGEDIKQANTLGDLYQIIIARS